MGDTVGFDRNTQPPAASEAETAQTIAEEPAFAAPVIDEPAAAVELREQMRTSSSIGSLVCAVISARLGDSFLEPSIRKRNSPAIKIPQALEEYMRKVASDVLPSLEDYGQRLDAAFKGAVADLELAQASSDEAHLAARKALLLASQYKAFEDAGLIVQKEGSNTLQSDEELNSKLEAAKGAASAGLAFGADEAIEGLDAYLNGLAEKKVRESAAVDESAVKVVRDYEASLDCLVNLSSFLGSTAPSSPEAESELASLGLESPVAFAEKINGTLCKETARFFVDIKNALIRFKDQLSSQERFGECGAVCEALQFMTDHAAGFPDSVKTAIEEREAALKAARARRKRG